MFTSLRLFLISTSVWETIERKRIVGKGKKIEFIKFYRKNEKYCKGNDLRGIHHPDTVLEDLYMANKYRPYEY
jgi:hypothetical protein